MAGGKSEAYHLPNRQTLETNMPNEYYPEPDQAPEGEETQEKTGGPSGLLSLSFLGGRKPEVGEILQVKVTHVYEDEILVEPVAKEETPSNELRGDEEFDQAEAASGMAGMSQGMMKG